MTASHAPYWPAIGNAPSGAPLPYLVVLPAWTCVCAPCILCSEAQYTQHMAWIVSPPPPVMPGEPQRTAYLVPVCKKCQNNEPVTWYYAAQNCARALA